MATRRKSRSKSLLSKGVSSVRKTSSKVTSGIVGVGKKVVGTAGKTIPAAQSGVRSIFSMFGLKTKSKKSRKSRKSRKR